jgi:hypothetical protein
VVVVVVVAFACLWEVVQLFLLVGANTMSCRQHNHNFRNKRETKTFVKKYILLKLLTYTVDHQ